MPERRQMGELARSGPKTSAAAALDDEVDETRARLVLPTLALLLGTQPANP